MGRNHRRGAWEVHIYFDPDKRIEGADYNYTFPRWMEEKEVRKCIKNRKDAILAKANKDGHF
jgi:hypothetical protein